MSRASSSGASSSSADLTPASIHFQVLVVGTAIFLVALFWFTHLPHTNTFEARVAAAVPRLIHGLQVLGCYGAWVSMIFGHKWFASNSNGARER